MRSGVMWAATAALIPLGVVAGLLLATGDEEEPKTSIPLADAESASPPGIPADGSLDTAQLSTTPAPPPVDPVPEPTSAEAKGSGAPGRVKEANRGYSSSDELERRADTKVERPPMVPATVPTTISEYKEMMKPPLVIVAPPATLPPSPSPAP